MSLFSCRQKVGFLSGSILCFRSERLGYRLKLRVSLLLIFFNQNVLLALKLTWDDFVLFYVMG